MSLPKYQVHDETSQVSHNSLSSMEWVCASNRMGRLYASDSIVYAFVTYWMRYFHVTVLLNIIQKKKNTIRKESMSPLIKYFLKI